MSSNLCIGIKLVELQLTRLLLIKKKRENKKSIVGNIIQHSYREKTITSKNMTPGRYNRNSVV